MIVPRRTIKHAFSKGGTTMLLVTGFIEIARNYLVWHRNRFSNLALGRCLNRAALIIVASVGFFGAVEASTNFYVDPNWTGRKSGTQAHPFAMPDMETPFRPGVFRPGCWKQEVLNHPPSLDTGLPETFLSHPETTSGLRVD